MFLKKQTSLLFIPLIFSVFLTSCTPNDNGSNNTSNDSNVLIPQITTSAINQENYALPMTKARFSAFKEGKRSFILLFSSKLCGHCRELEPLLINYVKEKKVEIYKIELTSEEYINNSGFYEKEIDFEGQTPTIFIFAKGEIVKRELGTGKLKTRKEVITFFDFYIRTSKYFVLQTEREEADDQKSIYFQFDFNSEFSQNLINNNFYPLFSNRNSVYLIDESAKSEIEISFSDYDEVFTFNEENSDLTAALTFFNTNFS